MSKRLYVESEKKNRVQNKLTYKRENSHRCRERKKKNLMITKGEMREEINLEIGIDICTLIYI